ncbi:MAG: ABC transporter ATP-binding protein [Chitinophagales bacterium]
MLEVKNIEVFYGAIQALHDVSFSVEEGEIVTLIGANGAGKSTTLRAISGLIHPRKGEIFYRNTDISRVPPHKIVNMGISHVPEGRRILPGLTVLENLRLGAYTRHDKREIGISMERVFASFPRLKERLNQPAGTMSGGEQQMLAIGRALMARPSLMILDEPSMGLSPLLVQEIFSIIKTINQEGTTVLLVEQNAFMALKVAHRGYVLETGNIVLSGSASELEQNPKVRAAYLGEVSK